ncbi:MAG: FAD-dependent oxidoreductase [Candidatus Bathyarchaeia archaeon]
MTWLPLPKAWDEEFDIIVVGAGTAGLPAAAMAAKQKVNVVVLEQMPCCAGSPSYIGGYLNACGTEYQKKLGINDSKELMYKDYIETCKGDPTLLKIFVEDAPTTVEIIKQYGVEPRAVQRIPGASVPRAHMYEGVQILRALERLAKDYKVEIRFKHKFLDLYRDPESKRVVGVKVRRGRGEYLNFRAKKAVILASGGWISNPMMMWDLGSYAHAKEAVALARGHTGEGVMAALRIGAHLKWVGCAVRGSTGIDANTLHPHALTWGPLTWAGGIMVNIEGRRFVDESGILFPTLGDAVFSQPGHMAFCIYDAKLRPSIVKALHEAGIEIAWYKEYQADSLDKLAREIGVPTDIFVKEVQEYNEDVKKYGYDRRFGRNFIPVLQSKPIPIETPPFYAVKGMSAHTSLKSSLELDSEMRIVDLRGEPIPGLYGAGEVACGGLFRDGWYPCGTMMNMGQVFGRRAGTIAATKEPR